jgi:hypothetical protein
MMERAAHMLVALLLRLYPRDFRDHYGAELQLDFAKRSSIAWLLDLARNGLRERFRAEAQSPRATRAGIACIILAVLHFLYDFAVPDRMGAAALLLTSAVAALGIRLCWRGKRVIPL